MLATGTVRTIAQGPVARLPGYDEGSWWVQDAAAALPVRLFGEVAGLAIADLCAAPGGKTAQLAFAGARVTAVDRSARRLTRLAANLARLGLRAEVVEADAAEWAGGPFDGVLLDAPCLSTGTIRRHPDIAWLKRESDLGGARAGAGAAARSCGGWLLKPGGRLVYCVCSLEPEEGEQQVEALLARTPWAAARADRAGGDCRPGRGRHAGRRLRTLPCHLPHADPRMGGLDGFYAARLSRD